MFKILFKYGSCGNPLALADTSAGMQVDCPKCRSSLTVPQTANAYACPHSDCSQAMKIDTALKGERLQCPSCNKPIALPFQRAELIVFLCKRCEEIIEISIAMAGKLLFCPKCDQWIRGPELNQIAVA